MPEPEEIQAEWTEIAPGYDAYVTPPNMTMAEETLQRARLRPKMRVPDVAAGSGALSGDDPKLERPEAFLEALRGALDGNPSERRTSLTS